MALRYLFDEHLRGELWRAVGTYNSHAQDPLDVVRVGDPDDLPLSSRDPDILAWAEHAGRVIVSRDRRTMSPTSLLTSPRVMARPACSSSGAAPHSSTCWRFSLKRPAPAIPSNGAIRSYLFHEQVLAVFQSRA